MGASSIRIQQVDYQTAVDLAGENSLSVPISAFKDISIIPSDSVECFTNDLAFPFDRASQDIITDVIIKRLTCSKRFDRICCLDDIVQMCGSVSLHRSALFLRKCVA
jgi:hypothetical protein